MFNSFNPNLRNSLPEISCCLDGERGNPHSPRDSDLGLHQGSLCELLGTIPVLRNQTPGFPAHLIIPQLIPHALVIEPVPGNKDHDKDKHSCKGKTRNIQSRFEELSQEQERISRMKSTMNHVESAIEGLNGVLSGKI